MSTTVVTQTYENGFSLFGPPRNALLSKWDSVFEKNPKEWIAFRPSLGLLVFPCYSCRHMFSSKKSFQDHVNRRAVVLKYKCTKCPGESNLNFFYNRCAFLIHTRKHYTLQQGEINLGNLEIFSLPLGLAGFSKHPDIPYLYDVDEAEYINNDDVYINAQFYAPRIEDRGKSIVTLNPSDLVINKTDSNGEIQALALKQVSRNIPLCQFITLQAQKQLRQQFIIEDMIKMEPTEVETTEEQHEASSDQAEPSSTAGISEMTLPIITKIESVAQDSIISTWPKCPECKECQKQPMTDHFLGDNKPASKGLRCNVCKLIATTRCALKAHLRIHDRLTPYICPECGRDFEQFENLQKHMDGVCFHLSKSVRYRCPGKKCGKLFAVPQTFGQHFTTHMIKMFGCDVCKSTFPTLEDVQTHADTTHPNQTCAVDRRYQCGVCPNPITLDEAGFKMHVSWHANDRERCLYVYLCRFCKSYFRSTQTYATHLVKCSVTHGGKAKKLKSFEHFAFSKYISGECEVCKNKIIYTQDKKVTICARCKHTRFTSDKCCCILCKALITLEERKTHQRTCKYAHPRIMVERMNLEEYYKNGGLNVSFASSNSSSPLASTPDSIEKKRSRPDSSPNSSSEPGSTKKKRSSNPSNKPKKPVIEFDMTAEEPIPFDGTYQCRLCTFKDTSRDSFHAHIKDHRDTSTTYQCMECGECFVVRPSLVKHLLHFHDIKDFERYFEDNDCFDQTAVKELAEVVKLAPYVAKNTVKENQCKVCLEEFETKEELDKHFRVHGMAFLVKNSL